MLGVSGLLGSSGDGAAAAEAPESGGGSSSGGGGGEVSGVGPNAGGGFSEEDQKVKIEDGERNSGGNRWPRQETIALLKIRSDMDVAFRDSSLKGPLWEEVSRKLAELGYHRSAKKCKEKFENVYKYHKRTKDGRSSKSDGKTYRFFDQLEAFENHPSLPLLPPPPPRPQTAVAVTTTAAVSMPGTNPPIVSQATVVSAISPLNIFQNTVSPSLNPTNPSPPPPRPPPPPPPTTTNPTNPSQSTPIPSFHPNMSVNFMSNSNSSSSTSSDEDLERRHRRKRKWKDFFERLMKEVIEKQEELQKKFLETLEKRERDRMVREEAWRVQEMARMNREHDLLVQERSIAAAKDAAVIAFLQKISEQQNQNVVPVQMPLPVPENPLPPQPPPPPPPAAVMHTPPPAPPPPTKNFDNPKTDNGGENFVPNASSSRWPKAEVEALIRLRTSLDLKYQESGPKGPLWEEMSAGMRKLGYNRSAKRCKEKWENINKYFKKVKESNKKRPEDSKTCPYFHQLDALYKEKNKTETSSFNPGGFPIMARPEQQWPLPQDQQQHPPEPAMEDHDQSEHIDQNHEEDEDGSDEDDDDEGGGYEIVTKKPSSAAMVE